MEIILFFVPKTVSISGRSLFVTSANKHEASLIWNDYRYLWTFYVVVESGFPRMWKPTHIIVSSASYKHRNIRISQISNLKKTRQSSRLKYEKVDFYWKIIARFHSKMYHNYNYLYIIKIFTLKISTLLPCNRKFIYVFAIVFWWSIRHSIRQAVKKNCLLPFEKK